MLEQEGGAIIKIDTRRIMDHVEIEKLSSEEILEIKSYLGMYSAFVQLKKYQYVSHFGNCAYHVYRLILVNDEIAGNPGSNMNMSFLIDASQ